MKPFTFTVTVEVERTEGKFASRDEIAEVLLDALAEADIGSFSCEGGGEYETASWDVVEVTL